jgi:hypothetical protein
VITTSQLSSQTAIQLGSHAIKGVFNLFSHCSASSACANEAVPNRSRR